MMGPTIDILLYHDVCSTTEQIKLCSNPRYTTPLQKLEYHLDWLCHSEFRAIRLGEWLDARMEGTLWEGKHVLLTFDGPHTGWFEHVIPLLVRLELPATFFVIAGWVGAQHRFPESRHLTWDNIAQIEEFKDRSRRQLFDVGSHSMWHTTLDMQDSEKESTYRKRLDEEIVKASSLIRKRTGFPVRTYATPEGRGDARSLKEMFKLAGIQAVRWASFDGKRNQYHKDLFDLQISYCDTTEQSFDRMAVLLSRKPPSFSKKLVWWLISRLNRISR